MEQTLNMRDRFRIIAVMLVIATIAILVFTFYFRSNFSSQSITQNTQALILEKDAALISELDYLQGIFLNNPDSIFEVLPQYKNYYDHKGYFFVISQNEKILFWSDNKVPIKADIIHRTAPVVFAGNGWYRKINRPDNNVLYTAFYLIKHDYNYQNDYLENSFHPSFNIDEATDLSINPDDANKIYDSDGCFLFALSFAQTKHISSSEANILFLLYVFFLLAILAIIYELHLYFFQKNGHRFLFIAGFIADLLIVRFILFYFKIPSVLYQSPLFSPSYYAYSDIIPTLADLFLNVVFILCLAFFFFHHFKFKKHNLKKNRFHKYFLIFSLFLHIFIFFKGVDFMFQTLIIDSSICIDLSNIFNLSLMSLFNLLIISMFLLAYVLITSKLAWFAFAYSQNIWTYSLFALLAAGTFITFCSIRNTCDFYLLSFVLLYILSLGLYYTKNETRFTLANAVVYVLLFSIISTYLLNRYNTQKEQEHRKLLAVHLASEQRDPLAEYMFETESQLIIADTILHDFLKNYGFDDFDYSAFHSYFTQSYFKGYWKKYDCQLTICTPDDNLILQPGDYDINCNAYFDEKIEDNGQATDNKNLFFLRYNPGENGYIAVINFSDSILDIDALKIYIELYPKYAARDLGFPDLLIDKSVNTSPDLSSYSYAKYQNGELYKRVGDYFYNFNLRHYKHSKDPFVLINQNNYSHLLFNINKERSLIISTKNKSTLVILAPFSYLFLFYILFFSFFYLLFIFPLSHHKISLNFRSRLQLSIISVILFSFIVVGIFTLYYINNLNEAKNQDILSEKTHSILVEMQHKFSTEERLDESLREKLSEMLVKFSNVFFTDINMYDPGGVLISSSRQQIYDEDLISNYINPMAYKAMVVDNNSLFIHNENIGKQCYLSAYIPFVNNMGEVIGYLNLPYFAQEKDLNKEISTFLVAYINIYVILIALSVLIAIIISRYISHPINLMISKIRQVKLGGQNETILWQRDDEIGQLVEEYNRMIEELARSAELLAKSERESAWREMAKQIAHEIKNPLTPMKLSVQYLQRSWKNQAPDYEKRLDKFTQTMIEQIDALSIIASEFSDFAKMPISKRTHVNLTEIIDNSIVLFKNYDNITFSFIVDDKSDFTVYADKEQLLRAFNNLLTNSIQAIGSKVNGVIEIKLDRQFSNIVVEITDNGEGISDEISGKIFSPNFTTKSGGMGLGLAIVKNIVINAGGSIEFVSNAGHTTFTLVFPAFKNR